jgi:hypothetical protein
LAANFAISGIVSRSHEESGADALVKGFSGLESGVSEEVVRRDMEAAIAELLFKVRAFCFILEELG